MGAKTLLFFVFYPFLFLLFLFFFFFFFETLPLSKKANVYYRVKTAYDSHTLTKKDQTDGGVI